MERLVFMIVYIAFLVRHEKKSPEDHMFFKVVFNLLLALITTICMFVAAAIVQPLLPFIISGLGGYLAYRFFSHLPK